MISNVTGMTRKNLWNFQMYIYYEGMDNKLEECVKAQLIPSNSLANEEGVEAVAWSWD